MLSLFAKKTPGSESERLKSWALGNLGVIYIDKQMWLQSHKCLEGSLELTKELLGPEHPFCGSIIQDLGTLCFVQYLYAEGAKQPEQLDLASNYYEDALRIRRKAFTDKHTLTARALYSLAFVEYEQGHLANAHQDLIKAKEIIDVTSPMSIDRAWLCEKLRDICFEAGRLQEAKNYATYAADNYELAIGKFQIQTVQAYIWLASISYRVLDYSTCQSSCIKALQALEDESFDRINNWVPGFSSIMSTAFSTLSIRSVSYIWRKRSSVMRKHYSCPVLATAPLSVTANTRLII